MSQAQSILKLEEFRDQRNDLLRQLENYQKKYKVGMWGILIGLILTPLYGLGLILVVAGGLAAITNASKRSDIKAKLTSIDASIQKLREKIATENP